MKHRFLALVLVWCLLTGLTLPVAATDPQQYAADRLYALGLFNGVGTNADGSPDYALERPLSRQEAVTMLVRLLGNEQEALTGNYRMPFTDVDDWAIPYVAYAYEMGLTTGLSATAFGGTQPVTAAQYITFILRAIGYVSGVHFAWDTAWEFSDMLSITAGEYQAANNHDFLRGDAVSVSSGALDAHLADGSGRTLLEMLKEQGAVSDRVVAPSDSAEESLSHVLRRFVQEMMETEGETVRTEYPDSLDDVRGWTLYYEDTTGTAEDALLAVFRNYLKGCLDGNYVRERPLNSFGDGHLSDEQYASQYDPLFIPSSLSNIHAFLHTDREGMITAFGTYEVGDPDGYTATLCQVDSTQVVDLLRTAYASAGEGLTLVDCQLEEQGDTLMCTFADIPENAVWIYESRSNTINRDGSYEVPYYLRDAWIDLLQGLGEPEPVQSQFVARKNLSDRSGILSRLYVFLDADYNMIAYAVGKMVIQ